MNPKSPSSFEMERTGDMPAQEQATFTGETLVVVATEQVYAQRLSETIFEHGVPTPVFVP
ncbi:MAG: hypothetical protein DDG60_12435 [Anaerolineae bacterium]|nr:MAG: hypothetical protein DDG60_12435 [Anaerolineae bacterium]